LAYLAIAILLLGAAFMAWVETREEMKADESGDDINTEGEETYGDEDL